MATALALAAAVSPASAEVALFMTDGSGDATSVEIGPGGTFQVSVGLGAIEGLLGLTYVLSISDNGSGKFWIAQRSVDDANPFPDLTATDQLVVETAAALLDPSSDRDLGGLVEDLDVTPIPGIYTLAVFTIASATDVPPGSYTLKFGGSPTTPGAAAGANSAFEDIDIPGNTYTIVVSASGPTNGSDPDPDDDTDGGSNAGNDDDTDTTDPDTPTDNDSDSGSDDGSSNGNNSGDQGDDAGSEATPNLCGGSSTAAIVTAMLGLALMRRRQRPSW